MRARWIGTVLLVVCAAAANAQPVHAGGGVAATRSVSRYLALEREVQQALAARDETALQAHVDAAFEYRTPASDEVQGFDAWLHRARHATGRIRDLTVHEEGDIAVVSFLADSRSGTRFIVDVWAGDMLVARSSALAPEARKGSRRPSGRE